MAEMERCPLRSRRCFIHSGVGAFALIPLITLPEKRPHKSGASTLTGNLSFDVTLAGSETGRFNLAPVSAEISRATPSKDRQSALFGVSLMSKMESSSWR